MSEVGVRADGRAAEPRHGAASHWVARLAGQLVLILVAVGLYRAVRSLTAGEHDTAVRNSLAVLSFEGELQLDVERGMQAFVLDHPLLVDLANTVYVWGFWSLVALTLLVLYLLDRAWFRWYRNALFLSGAVGLVVFAAFPVAPPRMLTGFVDTIREFSGSAEMAHPTSFTNEYAAMPSFHVGWLVLAGVAVMPVVRRRVLRPLLLVPAVVMTLTVMVTANHYLLDALAGAAVALGGLLAARRLPPVATLWTVIDARVFRPHGGLGPVLVRAVTAAGRGFVPFVGARPVRDYLAIGGDGTAPFTEPVTTRGRAGLEPRTR